MELLCRRENLLNEKRNYILRYILRKAKPERTCYSTGRIWLHPTSYSSMPVELRLDLLCHPVPCACIVQIIKRVRGVFGGRWNRKSYPRRALAPTSGCRVLKPSPKMVPSAGKEHANQLSLRGIPWESLLYIETFLIPAC